MNLHEKIMNIQVDEDKMWASIFALNDAFGVGTDARLAYKLGHRDARHAAARFAAKQRGYADHEFCRAIECRWLSTESGHGPQCCSTGCDFSAKEFHKWLKADGYKIVNDGDQ